MWLAFTIAGLLACPAAWRPGAATAFEVQVPAAWEVSRNYRWLNTHNLTIRRGGAAVSIRVEPNRGKARRLPLSVLASVRALSWGRHLGVASVIVAEHELVVDDRRGCAVTGLRRWRTATVGYTMILVRGDARLAELALHAPPSELDDATQGWDAILSSFRLHDSPAPPPTFVDDSWPR